jgi:hypothetical protein
MEIEAIQHPLLILLMDKDNRLIVIITLSKYLITYSVIIMILIIFLITLSLMETELMLIILMQIVSVQVTST